MTLPRLGSRVRTLLPPRASGAANTYPPSTGLEVGHVGHPVGADPPTGDEHRVRRGAGRLRRARDPPGRREELLLLLRPRGPRPRQVVLSPNGRATCRAEVL